jgi:hypothetical protein
MLFCFESSFLVSFFFASNLDSCFKLWPESFAAFADLFQPDYLVVIAVYLIVAPHRPLSRPLLVCLCLESWTQESCKPIHREKATDGTG